MTERIDTALLAAASLRSGTAPVELLEALRPGIERGHSLAIVAAAGSGLTVLYAVVAAADHDPDGPAPQALVVTPTAGAALRIARAAAAVGRPFGLRARVLDAGSDSTPAHLVAGPPGPMLASIRGGRLSTGGLRTLVVDAADALRELGEWSAVEALLDTTADARKMVATASLDSGIVELLDRKLPRARRWPPELFRPFQPGAPTAADEDAGPPLWIGEGATRDRRLELIAAALRSPPGASASGPATVWCADAAQGERISTGLSALGLPVAETDGGEGFRMATGQDAAGDGPSVQCGLPGDPLELERRLGASRPRIAVVPTEHLTQVGILAQRLGWATELLPEPAPPVDAVERLRARIRERAAEVEPGPQLLVLEPLLREIGSARVAAALASLLQDRAEPAPPGLGDPAAVAAGPVWRRIYVDVGRQDDAGPADLVGAITGETEAVAGQIGKIDVRARFTLVELDSGVVDEVLRSLQGATIKGRSVTPRLDREPR